MLDPACCCNALPACTDRQHCQHVQTGGDRQDAPDRVAACTGMALLQQIASLDNEHRWHDLHSMSCAFLRGWPMTCSQAAAGQWVRSSPCQRRARRATKPLCHQPRRCPERACACCRPTAGRSGVQPSLQAEPHGPAPLPLLQQSHAPARPAHMLPVRQLQTGSMLRPQLHGHLQRCCLFSNVSSGCA